MAEDQEGGGNNVTALRPERKIIVPGPQMDVWNKMSEYCGYRVPQAMVVQLAQQVGGDADRRVCNHAGSHPTHHCTYLNCPLIRDLIK